MSWDEGHYLTFETAFQRDTSEKDRPSLAKPMNRRKSLPFAPSVQHAVAYPGGGGGGGGTGVFEHPPQRQLM